MLFKYTSTWIVLYFVFVLLWKASVVFISVRSPVALLPVPSQCSASAAMFVEYTINKVKQMLNRVHQNVSTDDLIITTRRCIRQVNEGHVDVLLSPPPLCTPVTFPQRDPESRDDNHVNIIQCSVFTWSFALGVTNSPPITFRSEGFSTLWSEACPPPGPLTWLVKPCCRRLGPAWTVCQHPWTLRVLTRWKSLAGSQATARLRSARQRWTIPLTRFSVQMAVKWGYKFIKNYFLGQWLPSTSFREIYPSP